MNKVAHLTVMGKYAEITAVVARVGFAENITSVRMVPVFTNRGVVTVPAIRP